MTKNERLETLLPSFDGFYQGHWEQEMERA